MSVKADRRIYESPYGSLRKNVKEKEEVKVVLFIIIFAIAIMPSVLFRNNHLGRTYAARYLLGRVSWWGMRSLQFC